MTHIRFRKLVSTDRYGHVAVELEAELSAADDFDASMQALRAQVELQLNALAERDRLCASLQQLREEAVVLERRRDGLRDDINANRKILRAHEELEQLARERGIDPAGLNAEIPF